MNERDHPGDIFKVDNWLPLEIRPGNPGNCPKCGHIKPAFGNVNYYSRFFYPNGQVAVVVMTGLRVPTMVRLYYDVGKNINNFGYA